MGMYDNVCFEKSPIKCKCGKKLTYFQTKSINCEMEGYYVGKNNKIRKENGKDRRRWINLKWTTILVCCNFCECNKWFFDLVLFLREGKIYKKVIV